MSSHETLLQATSAVRDAAWRAWGELAPDVLAHLINPTFMGGPRWPAMRQAYRVARQPDRTLIASDGLADPFDDDETGARGNGVGLEFYAITDEPNDNVAATTAFDVVWQASQFAASRGDLVEVVAELGIVTTELWDVRLPADAEDLYRNQAGRVGVMLGLTGPTPPALLDGPCGPIRLINLKLLRLDELAFVVAGGHKARHELAARFASQAEPRLSSLDRPSVLAQ